jgi:hypothetical protein
MIFLKGRQKMKLFALRSAGWTILALCLVFATAASATPIFPGQTQPGTPLTPIQFGPTLGTLSGSFTNGPLSGTYTEVVFQDAGTGNLDFVYAVTESSGSTDNLARTNTTGFAGFSTNVGYGPTSLEPGTPTATPTTVDRSTSGSTVGFNFLLTGAPPDFAPGASSFNLVIETNATGFATTPNALNFIDGGTAQATGFTPLAPAPEPASYLLMGTGMLICAFFLRRNMGTSSAGITAA